MSNANERAYPAIDPNEGTEWGLSKRELFAAMAMQGELSCQSDDMGAWGSESFDHENLALFCVGRADALLAALEVNSDE